MGRAVADGKGALRLRPGHPREPVCGRAAFSDDYRLEIVGNLDAYLAGTGPYERLTLSAGEIRERAVPRLYDVRLEGLQERIRTVDLAPGDA